MFAEAALGEGTPRDAEAQPKSGAQNLEGLTVPPPPTFAGEAAAEQRLSGTAADARAQQLPNSGANNARGTKDMEDTQSTQMYLLF